MAENDPDIGQLVIKDLQNLIFSMSSWLNLGHYSNYCIPFSFFEQNGIYRKKKNGYTETA